MKNLLLKDILYFLVFIYVFSFFLNYRSTKIFNEALSLTVAQSIEIIIGSLIISIILHIRRKNKEEGK